MSSISFNADFITKFIKFGFVGISGVLVDFSITYFCKEKLNIGKYISNSLGFIMATLSNFYLNQAWTFTDRAHHAISSEFPKFLGFALIGLLINTFVLFLMTERLKFNFYLAKIFAILVVSIWNFLGNYLYTFAA